MEGSQRTDSGDYVSRQQVDRDYWIKYLEEKTLINIEVNYDPVYPGYDFTWTILCDIHVIILQPDLNIITLIIIIRCYMLLLHSMDLYNFFRNVNIIKMAIKYITIRLWH